MNIDTDELTVTAHQVWHASRQVFLSHHGVRDNYHSKFFARVDAKQGYPIILRALSQQALSYVSVEQYKNYCQSLSIEGKFMDDISGFDAKENEKTNLKNFFTFLKNILEVPHVPSHASVASNLRPDVAHILQKKCEAFAASSSKYIWNTDEEIVNKMHRKIERKLSECISQSALLNENTIGYLLRFHLEAETTPSAVEMVFPHCYISYFTQHTNVVSIDHYTMQKIFDDLWEKLEHSITWEVQCLENGLITVFNTKTPIAFSHKSRHNI